MVKRENDRVSVAEAVYRKTKGKAKYFHRRGRDADSTLRLEHGYPDTKIPPTATVAAVGTAAVWLAKEQKMEADREIQAGRERRLVDLAARYDGFRGVGFRLLQQVVKVYPRTTIKWDTDMLKDRLGARAESVVTTDVVVTAKAPLGAETRFGPLTEDMAKAASYAGWLAIGFKPEDEDKILTARTDDTVDLHKLQELVESGLDLEGAAVARQTWVVEHGPWNPQSETT